MNLSDSIASQVKTILSTGSHSNSDKLHFALRLLAKWRSHLIQNTLIKNEGTRVISGPFKSFDFIEKSAEGCHVAKLLGCYEQPLHPHINKAFNKGYETVINIGCAEGYYAVGFPYKVTGIVSYAFDVDEKAQRACSELAAKNGVEDRVIVKGRLDPEDFEHYGTPNTLVFCDIEGAEEFLLDPIKAPILKRMDIIVESHECLRKGITSELTLRFSESHDIVRVDDNGLRLLKELPDWFLKLNHLDQLLAVWEWRSGPTPWLVMTAKSSV